MAKRVTKPKSKSHRESKPEPKSMPESKSKPRPKRSSNAVRSQAGQIDREMAARAIQARAAGETPGAAELAALRRWEKAEEEERRWRIYESLPKKDWEAMSGRQPKVINEQVDRYGLPRRWGIDPAEIANRLGLRWISLRSEVGEVSFDLIAQARSWMEFCPWVPFYVGDTAAGLWMAFKALAGEDPGHFCIGHATCMQKLIEGELVIDIERAGDTIPWDRDEYRCVDGEAVIDYRGETYREPARSSEWKRDNLWHSAGRMRI